MTNDIASVNQSGESSSTPPDGRITISTGQVQAGDLEWTINARWQPVHISLIGRLICSLPGKIVARMPGK